MLTARQGRLALQETFNTEGLTEYLRERWRQFTGSRHQLQSPERVKTSVGLKYLVYSKDKQRFVSSQHVTARGLTEEL